MREDGGPMITERDSKGAGFGAPLRSGIRNGYQHPIQVNTPAISYLTLQQKELLEKVDTALDLNLF